jgi:hypothetical protein
MMSSDDPEQRFEWLAQLKHEAMSRRSRILAYVGPHGRTPLHSVRVVEGNGGPRRHESSEGVTLWDEPDRRYLARFIQADGAAGLEMQVEEDDALRWAFALGWGLETD